jgi:hypothetical protein
MITLYNTKKEGQMDWSHLALELLGRSRYLRIDIGKDRSEEKPRKKT